MPNSFLKLEDDHLNRHIERRGRFVEHQKLGLDRDGAGDADTGALAAGQLMRVTRQERQRQPALRSHGLDPLGQRLAAHLAQTAQRIGDGVEGGEARIDAFAGILEHHLDAGAVAIAGEDARRLQRQLTGAEFYAAVADVDQPRQRPHQGRLAAAGLADKTDCLALVDGEAHIIDGVHLRELFRSAGKTPLESRQRPRSATDRKQFRYIGNIKQDGHAALSVSAAAVRSGNGFQHATIWPDAEVERGNGCAQASILRGQRSV